jgi:hypothetical protein
MFANLRTDKGCDRYPGDNLPLCGKRDAVMANAISKRPKPQNLTAFPSRRGHVQNDDLVAGQFQEALDALL